MKPHPAYHYYPGGQPAWPSTWRRAAEPVEMRICQCCGQAKPVTSYGNGNVRCGACRYAATTQAKTRAVRSMEGHALTSAGHRVSLAPRKYINTRTPHGGAYSKA